jgi:prepilin-type N-terminal cleavage/methylation domain-containing protein/prepilin-type processing-associated H-X9-DG protein
MRFHLKSSDFLRRLARGEQTCMPDESGSAFRPPRSAFTLVELLVVITIIGILIALLLPAVQAAREAARRLQCVNNFKQAGVAMHNYHAAKGCFPPGMFAQNPGGTTKTYLYYSWSAYILPYMEREGIYNRINFSAMYSYFDGGPTGATNRVMSNTLLPCYLCPSDPQWGEGIWVSPANSAKPAPQCAPADMAGVTDSRNWLRSGGMPEDFPTSDGVMGGNRPCTIANIKDGTSNTLMIGECTGGGKGTYLGEFWAAWNLYDTYEGINGPHSVPGGATKATYDVNLAGFSSFHSGGCNFLLADGSATFLSQNIAKNVLAALTTRAGPSARNISTYGVSRTEVLLSGSP